MLREERLAARPVRFYCPFTFFMVFVCACGGDRIPTPRRSSPSVSPAPVHTEVSWVDVYGAIVDMPPSPKEEGLWRSLTGLRCKRDPRLSKAARHHAETLMESSGADADGEMDHLRFTVYQLGGYDYGLEPTVTHLSAEGIAKLSAVADERGNRWTHCGLGVAEKGNQGVAVLVGTARTITLSPLPTSVSPPATLRLSVRSVRKAAGDVSLFIGNPDTTVTAVSALRKGDRFYFEIPIADTGRYELELLHDRGHGPETAVLIPVFAGVERAPRPTVVPNADADRYTSPDTLLLRYINTARKRVGVSRLQRDSRLDRVAERHSDDMVKHSFFGHISPLNGGLKRRLDRAGLRPTQSAENIAESSTPLRIHRNLMGSPAHRINILNPLYTHVGIGIAQGKEQIATEIFAAWR